MNRHLQSSMAGVAVFGVCVQISLGAEADSGLIEEIVVTAQKRAESLQSIPAAITAFSAKDLEAFDFVDPKDLAAQTPGLQIRSSEGETKPNVFLRGIGSNDFNVNASAAVGFYADEVYQGLQAGQLFQMFDLERVEVLRGPQGTLYGRNTTGGAINFISRKPDGEYDYNTAVSYGRFDALEVEAAGQVPIVGDRLSARIAGVFRSANGNERNTFTGEEVGDFDKWAMRGILKWTPADSQTWLLNLHGGKLDGESPRYHFLRVNNGHYPDAVLPLIGVSAPYQEGNDFWEGAWDLPQNEEVTSFGGALSGAIKLPGAMLDLITGYENVEAFTRFDSDASPLDFVNVSFADESWQASQEVRLTSDRDSRFQWMVGLYGYIDRIDAYNQFDIGHFQRTLFGALPNPSDPLAPINLVLAYEQKTRSAAAFQSSSYQFTPKLKGTLGLRYTYDEKEIDYTSLADESDTIGVITFFNVQRKNNWSAVSGNVILDHQLTEDALLYASYNRGYKGGAYNGTAFFNPAEVAAVDPEKVNAYEIGAKTQWLNRGLIVNTAAFYNDFSDLQVFRFIPDPTTGIPSTRLTNAAAATIKGVELEIVARPVASLMMQISGAYLDAKYDTYILADDNPVTLENEFADGSGNTLVSAPEWMASGAIEYQFVLPKDMTVTPRVEFSYRTSQFFEATNDPALSQDAYGLVNASIALGWANDKASVVLWGRNLADKEYNYTILDLSDFGLNAAVRGQQRSFGATVRLRY